MALKIEDERAERLAQELARRTGESIEEAVATALEERLTRIEQPPRRKPDPQAIETLLARFRALPDLDSRSHEKILGYNEQPWNSRRSADIRSSWLARPMSASERAGIRRP